MLLHATIEVNVQVSASPPEDIPMRTVYFLFLSITAETKAKQKYESSAAK